MKCCNSENGDNLHTLADFLRIISDENRLRIICFLQKSNERCVCEIQAFLSLPQNLVSHHLKVLKGLEILNSEKRGLNVYYSINRQVLDDFRQLLSQILSEVDK